MLAVVPRCLDPGPVQPPYFRVSLLSSRGSKPIQGPVRKGAGQVNPGWFRATLAARSPRLEAVEPPTSRLEPSARLFTT